MGEIVKIAVIGVGARARLINMSNMLDIINMI